MRWSSGGGVSRNANWRAGLRGYTLIENVYQTLSFEFLWPAYVGESGAERWPQASMRTETGGARCPWNRVVASAPETLGAEDFRTKLRTDTESPSRLVTQISNQLVI